MNSRGRRRNAPRPRSAPTNPKSRVSGDAAKVLTIGRAWSAPGDAATRLDALPSRNRGLDASRLQPRLLACRRAAAGRYSVERNSFRLLRAPSFKANAQHAPEHRVSPTPFNLQRRANGLNSVLRRNAPRLPPAYFFTGVVFPAGVAGFFADVAAAGGFERFRKPSFCAAFLCPCLAAFSSHLIDSSRSCSTPFPVR